MCLNRTNICAHNQVVCLSLEIHSHWIFGFSNNMIEVVMRMSSTNLHQRKIFWNFIRKLVQMGLKKFRRHFKPFKRCSLIPFYLTSLLSPFTAPKIAWSTLSKPPLESILWDRNCGLYSFDDDSHLDCGNWCLWKKTHWIKISCSLTTTISYSTGWEKIR